jgi:MFS family permease
VRHSHRFLAAPPKIDAQALGYAWAMPSSDFSSLLSNRPYVRFWLTRLTSVMASQMLMVAIAWHMYDITSSAWDLGLVGLFQFVPALLLTLPAGHVADRHHRGRILSLCLFLQFAIALLLVAASHWQFATRELMLGISVMLGVARAFQMPAQQSLMPLLVPQSLLQRAIAMGSSGMQIAIICGPALGGLLYVYGPATVYATAAALLLAAITCALGIRYLHKPVAMAASWESVMAGLKFVWQRKMVLGATTLDLFAVLLGGAVALLPIYARDILHTGPVGLGLLRAAPAVGSLMASVALLRWPLRRHVGPKLLGAVALFGLATVVFGLSHSFTVSLLALAVTGAADSVSVVVRSTLIQLETPNEMRGRVSAVNSIFIGASNQLGEFESGATADAFGAVGSVVFGGVGTLLIAASWFKLFPALAQRDRLEKI